MQRYTPLFLISLLLLFTACGQQKKKDDEPSGKVIAARNAERKARNNELALQYHERLMEHFSADWIEREADPDLYPDYYGGSFIDNDGIFVIAVTTDSEGNREKLAEILGGDHFRIERVEYSYRQMMQVMDKIDAFLANRSIPEEHPLLLHFAGAYPDVMENRVKVILTKVNPTVVEAFKNDISRSPILLFEEGETPQLM